MNFEDAVASKQKRKKAVFGKDKSKLYSFSWATGGIPIGITSGDIFISLAWSVMLFAF